MAEAVVQLHRTVAEYMKQSKGFTLVELLVVIAIIGLLSTLAVVTLGSARGKARDARRVTDVKAIQTALELYYADLSAYPVQGTAVTLGLATTACFNNSAGGFAATACANPYMATVPTDPQSPSGTYQYTSLTGAGAACAAAPCASYKIDFSLEGPVGSLAAGAHTASPSGVI